MIILLLILLILIWDDIIGISIKISIIIVVGIIVAENNIITRGIIKISDNSTIGI